MTEKRINTPSQTLRDAAPELAPALGFLAEHYDLKPADSVKRIQEMASDEKLVMATALAHVVIAVEHYLTGLVMTCPETIGNVMKVSPQMGLMLAARVVNVVQTHGDDD